MPVVSRVLRNGSESQVDGLPDDLADILADPAARLWVDLFTIDIPTLEEMGRRFNFHPLAIEDCYHNIQRPKVDEYPHYLFFSFHSIDESGDGEIAMREIDGFLGPNYLVTVHEEASKEIEALLERCGRNQSTMERGSDYLFYSLLDLLVDTHFPVLDLIQDRIETAESQLFDNPDKNTLESIFLIKKELLSVRRIVGPQRDIVNALGSRGYAVISDATRLYLRDVQDHLIRLTELVETYRDLVNGAMDAYWTQSQQKLNEVMKVLTVIGTVNLPLTLIAGLWGMNFDRIPWAHDPLGFWYIFGLLILVVVGMLALFRAARWL
ncbi:MAG TPA: magnesium/cobalt transporter CorA [Candidatus Eisenbacteria bacterium]